LLINRDLAQLYGVQAQDINKGVKDYFDKFHEVHHQAKKE